MLKKRISVRISGWTILTLGVVLSLITSCVAPVFNGVASAQANYLQQDVNALQTAGNTGVLAQVYDLGQTNTARAGVAQLGSNQPVPWNARYRTGSVTKTFVAVTLLKLESEGRLSLNDTVNRWLPGVITGNGNDGTQITVRQLLNHTSGLFDYTSDEAFAAPYANADTFNDVRYRHYSPQELINIALSHQPDFAPGTSWSYSNTNYVVAGEVIKAVTGLPWEVAVTTRITLPLGLIGTSAPGDNPFIFGPHAHGYNIFTSDPENRVYTDTTNANMSWAGAAGALTSTTHDEIKFFRALLSGQVLPPAQLAELKTLVPLTPEFGYGLGIAREQLTCGNSTQEIWWHDGGLAGYTSWVGTTPDGSRSLALSLSTNTFADATYAVDSYNATRQLIEDVFCGSQSSGLGSNNQSQLKQSISSDRNHRLTGVLRPITDQLH